MHLNRDQQQQQQETNEDELSTAISRGASNSNSESLNCTSIRPARLSIFNVKDEAASEACQSGCVPNDSSKALPSSGASRAGQSTTTAGFSVNGNAHAEPACRRCRNHNIQEAWKGHKRVCPFKYDSSQFYCYFRN